MRKVRIEIENIQLAEMGVDQPIKYAVLNFNDSQFVGYWISINEVTFEKTIIFYIGSQTFNCEYNDHNLGLFTSILNDEKITR